MTDLNTVKLIQSRARTYGRVVTLIYDEDGMLDVVWYLDPKSKGRFASGVILDPLSFSEIEVEKQRKDDSESYLKNNFPFLRRK